MHGQLNIYPGNNNYQVLLEKQFIWNNNTLLTGKFIECKVINDLFRSSSL